MCFGAFGCNPVGIQDKMGTTDIPRMAETLQAKVVIPIHHDIWTNFQADTRETQVLWEMRRDRLQCGFHPFIWQVGGEYTYPKDKDHFEYHYECGFHDCFEAEPNVSFRSVL